MRKKVVILYGEMGAGKNYQGERLAERLGFDFLDGDDALPAHMAARVHNFKPLTREMINEFVYIDLTFAIQGQARNSPGVVVAQALYLRETREMLKGRLEDLGFDVDLKHIKVPFFQNLRQVFSRPRGTLWTLYWLANKPFFEP